MERVNGYIVLIDNILVGFETKEDAEACMYGLDEYGYDYVFLVEVQ